VKKQLSIIDKVQYKIHTIRGVQVILDRDLAAIYQVETRVLKQAVKRNIERFPEDFMIEISNEELKNLVSQSVIPTMQHIGGALPFAFTEQGVAMLSAILRSKIAIEINIEVMRAFVEMRKLIVGNAVIFQRMEKLEQKQIITETRLDGLFELIETEDVRPKQGIF